MITASLVLYQSAPDQFEGAIQSFLDAAPDGLLLISDNSPDPIHHQLFEHPRIRYKFNQANLGFGKGHNQTIQALPPESELHLLLNPDVRFSRDVLPALAQLMRHDLSIGAAMPRIAYPDGSLQRLCKLLPTPLDLLIRRFIPFPWVRHKINERYELHGLPQDAIVEVPTLSGCFMLVRTELFKMLGGFDERYFLYMEDVDLVRRIGDHARTVYVPGVTVMHKYGKGSYCDCKLLSYHLYSALKYFNKWGWWFDGVRAMRNKKMLESIAVCGDNQRHKSSSHYGAWRRFWGSEKI